MIAIRDRQVDKLMNKFGWIYFVLGNFLLFSYCSIHALQALDFVKTAFGKYLWLLTRVVSNLLKAFGEWIFMIGLIGVCKRYIQSYPSLLKNLVVLAMPFYLTHQQIAVRYADNLNVY